MEFEERCMMRIVAVIIFCAVLIIGVGVFIYASGWGSMPSYYTPNDTPIIIPNGYGVTVIP